MITSEQRHFLQTSIGGGITYAMVLCLFKTRFSVDHDEATKAIKEFVDEETIKANNRPWWRKLFEGF